VGDAGLAVFARHGHLEDAKVVLGHGCRIAVPVVEVANEECSHGVGRPLAVHDVAIWLDVEAVLLVPLRMLLAMEQLLQVKLAYSRELLQPAFCLVNLLDPLLCFREAALQRSLERL
jgi:hypothetical protein